MKAALFISFWVGFISLSLEIAWVRLYGYANNSTPQAFSYVLAVYLLGIAIGAQVGKRLCRVSSRKSIEIFALIVLAIAVPFAAAAPWMYLHSRSFALDGVFAPIAIFLTAGLLSILFPIVHHLGTPEVSSKNQPNKGKSFSQVYMLNVFGAALGPLVTGYVLLDRLTITQVFPSLALLLAMVVLTAWLMFGAMHRAFALTGLGLALVLPLWLLYSSWQFPGELAKSFAISDGRKIIAAHESRHGIITIAEDERREFAGEYFTDHIVYGGNVYDGKVNVSLERNTNGLERPLALHVLQPQAKKVLILGLSIGSWLTVVEGFPGVDSIDVVEINPGYLNLASGYEPQRRALKDPRVTVVVDDARRWLQYHPDKKYDLILMNTTWHWRANSSMLLSQEMMKLVSHHLSPSGVMAFNATGSVDAFYTASTVFKEVRRYQNFIYGAHWNPFDAAANAEAWNVLRTVTVDGKPAFGEGSVKVQEFSRLPFFRLDHDLKRLQRPPELITDDNMLVEYKYGRRH